jgi:hypothetical protein
LVPSASFPREFANGDMDWKGEEAAGALRALFFRMDLVDRF